jgi:hypothetical protein
MFYIILDSFFFLETGLCFVDQAGLKLSICGIIGLHLKKILRHILTICGILAGYLLA